MGIHEIENALSIICDEFDQGHPGILTVCMQDKFNEKFIFTMLDRETYICNTASILIEKIYSLYDYNNLFLFINYVNAGILDKLYLSLKTKEDS